MDNIDIIMPVYNCEKYIKEAINSVKKQTIKNWNLIIIEDKSQDNSLEEIYNNIQEIKEKVNVIENSKHIGIAHARNLGIKNSINKYIAFLDADDIWKEEKLEKQIKHMKENNCCFTYTKFTYLKGKRRKEVKLFPKSLNYNQALKNTFILTSTVVIDTSRIEKEIIYMPDVESEDTAAWWNILKNGNTAYGIKDNLCIYRVHKNGFSFNKLRNIKRTWKLYRIYEKMGLLKASYCFINYIIRAVIKRI